ncbi:MAG: Hpt domain-containing protein [Rhizomicrobium sp.]
MSDAASKVIDLDHLARYTGGDKAINAEVMRLFDTQASELVARLQGILDTRDAKSWKEITHTLKGAARGIGAFPMGDAAACCEPLDLADRGSRRDRHRRAEGALGSGSGLHPALPRRLSLPNDGRISRSQFITVT